MKRRALLAALLAVTVLTAGCSFGIYVPARYGDLSGYVYILSDAMYSSASDTGSSVEAVVLAHGGPPPGYEPLRGAEVWVSGRRNNTVETDNTGAFYLPRVPEGWQTINVRHEALRTDLKTRFPITPGILNVMESPLYASIGYYVIIGINNYQNLGTFDGGVEGATAFADAIEQNRLALVGELLTDSRATKNAIKSKIEQIISAAEGEDYLVLYFSGYSGANYISPYDAKTQSWDKDIMDSELDKWLRNFPGDVTVIIDGSESSTMADGEIRPAALKNNPKYTVIASAGTGENSYYEPSLGLTAFTYFLVEGLQLDSLGRAFADSDRDREITANELYDYVQKQVKEFYRGESQEDLPIPVIKRGETANTVLFRY